MGVQFKKTANGEIAILPRKDYEALVAKSAEADEDAGTARLLARVRKEIAEGAHVLPMALANRNAGEPISAMATFPTSRMAGARERRLH